MLLGWAVVFFASRAAAPPYTEVTQDGEFVFLPADSPSRRAEDLYRRAFPDSVQAEEDGAVQQNPLGSTVVIVVRRVDQRSGLTDDDKRWVEEVLVPELEQIAQHTGRAYIKMDGEVVAPTVNADEPLVQGIWSLGDRKIGPMLTSPDNHATLVALELKTEFLDRANALIIKEIEDHVREITDRRKQRELNVPVGLDIAISGSATVGRDMLYNEEASAAKTEMFTKFLVIVLLLIIYRAPLLALIPLLTVGLAVEVAIHLLRVMAGWGWVGLFNGIEVYVTVVTYGAGVDYCLFLIARYKEELDRGHTIAEAISLSVRNVGVALATSAGTSICGIGMMGFAEFGKFQQAGVGISFGLFVVLIASLSFTPAMLLLCGRWAFWPDTRQETIEPDAEMTPRFSLFTILQEQQWLDRLWEGVADFVSARPGKVFLGVVAVMLPFAIIGGMYHDHLSYGLLSDLPQTDTSVEGAKAVQNHFAAGIAGPTTVLLHNPGLDIPVGTAGIPEGVLFARTLSGQLQQKMDELDLVDIRSQDQPLGITRIAQEYISGQEGRRRGIAATNVIRNMARKTYVSQDGDLAGDVVRLDLLFDIDPFERTSIYRLTEVEQAIRQALPGAFEALLQERAEAAAFEADLEDDETEDDPPSASEAEDGDSAGGNGPAVDDALDHDTPDPGDREAIAAAARQMAEQTSVLSIGPTAGIRDLKNVTDRDQIRIYVLVVVAVYLVLVALLRKPAICAYLIVSVVFSYFVTLGFTFAVFWALDPSGFAGLDWKVPIFLFTILIAMGEDYNILLMARIDEEQRKYPPVKAVLVSLARTGSIISSCGIIMAGTFSSLCMGTLVGMIQLGFALAFGVLLDTFVVRPILVPAYLVMLHSGRFGRAGKWLGSRYEHELLQRPVEDSDSPLAG
jgi:putative drug exporter of the RND superfamily